MIEVKKKSLEISRSEKGQSLFCFPESYTVVDIETTGLSFHTDGIIEIGALRIRDRKETDSFHSLCNSGITIDKNITDLTGISNEMIETAPDISYVLKSFFDFLGEDIIVGHNINFDVNFIYDKSVEFLNMPLSNDFVDTLRLSKKLVPDLAHHRLEDLVCHFNIPCKNAHRALDDCRTEYLCFEKLRPLFDESVRIKHRYSERSKSKPKDKFSSSKVSVKDLVVDEEMFDPLNPLYDKYCVFTGKLERFTRQEAAEALIEIGGHFQSSVNKKTNYLVLGDYDYSNAIKGDKSSKHKKAEELNASGCDIKVISEKDYFEMIYYKLFERFKESKNGETNI